MSKMFENYNTPNMRYECNCESDSEEFIGNVKLLQDLKQRVYGVEAKYQMPFSLYFHLTEANGFSLETFISTCTVEFSIVSKMTHKPVLEKTFTAKTIFEPITNDLKIDITQEEAGKLKRESYGIELRLVYSTGFYMLYSEKDGLLVIR